MDLKLAGKNISLISLKSEHLEGLLAFSIDPGIWQYLSVALTSREDVYEWYEQAMKDEENGKTIVFVIIDNKTGEVLGSTRIFELDKKHKTAEVGWTWLNPKHFGRGINLEAKLLLLKYAFETLCLNRVQFKTDETNDRSQKALEKIGAKLEGVLRNFKTRRNGTLANSLVYSIIISEWEDAQKKIVRQLGELEPGNDLH